MIDLLYDAADKAERLLAEAADNGSQLVVFPEAFIGGYPRGSNFELAIGARTAKGREDFRKYLASAIDVPGKVQTFSVDDIKDDTKECLNCKVHFFFFFFRP